MRCGTAGAFKVDGGGGGSCVNSGLKGQYPWEPHDRNHLCMQSATVGTVTLGPVVQILIKLILD